MNARSDEETLNRLAQYNLQKHDYVFGIALVTSVLISMLRSFIESGKQKTGEETPEAVQALIDDLEAMMMAMMRGSGEAHVATGRDKAGRLLEEVFHIVKAPTTKIQ